MRVTADVGSVEIAEAMRDDESLLFDVLGELAHLCPVEKFAEHGYGGSLWQQAGVEWAHRLSRHIADNMTD